MPVPFLVVGAIALKAAAVIGGTVVAGAAASVAYDGIKDKGRNEGYQQGKEENQAELTALKKKLQNAQRLREEAKTELKNIVSNITDLSETDSHFFAKIGTILKGYTVFHIYVVACVAYAKAKCIDMDISPSEEEELMSLLLGMVREGFPPQLKSDIQSILDSDDRDACLSEYNSYRRKLSETMQGKLESTTDDIRNYVRAFKKCSEIEHELQTYA